MGYMVVTVVLVVSFQAFRVTTGKVLREIAEGPGGVILGRARNAYVRHLYGQDPENLGLYHMVLDSTVVPIDACVEAIVAMATGSRAIIRYRLILQKGVSIPVVWSRELPSKPTSVRVYRDNLGYWYAEEGRPAEPA